MNPKIILEGPDNAGKTTLANWLVDCVGCKYFHAGGPPKDADAEQACMDLQMDVLRSNEPYVIDRITGISQRVYNPNSDLDPKRAAWTADVLDMPGIVLVYCRPSTEWLSRSDRFTWREDESEEHRQKIIRNHMTFVERYDVIMLGLPKIFYDFHDAGSSTLRTIFKKMMTDDGWAKSWTTRVAQFNAKDRP